MGTRAQAGGKGRPGTVMRPTPNGPKIVESEGRRWTDETEARFLDELGASCNVTRAVVASGFSTATVYRRRRNDSGFDERWRVALAQGFDRLEALLLQRATEALEGRAPDPEYPIPAMTVAEIIRILQLHRNEVRGVGPGRPGQSTPPASLEQRRKTIMVRLEAIRADKRAEDHHG